MVLTRHSERGTMIKIKWDNVRRKDYEALAVVWSERPSWESNDNKESDTKVLEKNSRQNPHLIQRHRVPAHLARSKDRKEGSVVKGGWKEEKLHSRAPSHRPLLATSTSDSGFTLPLNILPHEHPTVNIPRHSTFVFLLMFLSSSHPARFLSDRINSIRP